MPTSESLPHFYQHHFQQLPDTRPTDLGQVNVFRLEESLALHPEPVQFGRRDFYKIAFLRRGQVAYHYAEGSTEAIGPALLFFNPLVPYTRQLLSDETTGFFCIFRADFFTGRDGIDLTKRPFLPPNDWPIYPLTASQEQEVSALFEKMLAEISSDYLLKYDLLRTYAAELVHYALKLRPAGTHYQHPDAKSRLTTTFLALLEQQFPIESPPSG